ncbi:MAG: NADPH-dependent FMN reductase [Actinomycetota bacterium]|nr:NAD(P)H-dependent oxidoreductase [Actinomycetota bacterium]
MGTPHIVGIGGTTRGGSSTEKALRFALAICGKEGSTTTVFGGPELATLPLYAPEHRERTDVAIRLVEELRRADGVIIASPAYHGSLSGLVKNALDYTEDMREDDRAYFSGRAVGLIATGAGWQGIVSTLEAQRAIVHALRGWATPMGVALNTSSPIFDAGGATTDERAIFQMTAMAHEIMLFATRTLSELEPAGPPA